MKRDDWEVPYTGEQIAKAASDKKVFHTGRVTWWTQKKNELMDKIRSDGLNITESVVDELAKTGYANTTNNAYGAPTIQIDAGLQMQLREAHQKVGAHKALVGQYDAWIQMLSNHRAVIFGLDNDDWMYFFGR